MSENKKYVLALTSINECHFSNNSGFTWEKLDLDFTTYLGSCDNNGHILLSAHVSGRNTIMLSVDHGITWIPQDISDDLCICLTSNNCNFYLLTKSGNVYKLNSETQVSTLISTIKEKNVKNIYVNNKSYMYVTTTRCLLTSKDGIEWTKIKEVRNCEMLTFDATGKNMCAVNDLTSLNQTILVSDDYGKSWLHTYMEDNISSSLFSVTSDSSGKYVTFINCKNSHVTNFYTSNDYGKTWILAGDKNYTSCKFIRIIDETHMIAIFGVSNIKMIKL